MWSRVLYRLSEPDGWVVAGFEFVEPPPETVLGCGSVFDQAFAVVDQQPHLAGGSVELSHRQIRFPKRSSGYRQRVDRIGLAPGASRPADAGHQLGWDPHHLITDPQQVGFETARQRPAVLDRPPPLLPPGRPLH